MNKLHLPQYNLQMTLLGGQSFAWDYEDDFYYGFTNKNIIKLKQENETLYWQTYPSTDDFDFIKKYFRLDVDYEKILKAIQKDKHIKKAIVKYPDLRLLKQDFEETLLSFIISSNNNIKSIRKIIRLLNFKFGKSISINKKKIYLFPDTEMLANASMNDLLVCKLGFRAKYLKSTARLLLETNLKEKIQSLDENKARNELLKIRGVGDKITDCVLVFGLGFDNVTPLDVWAKRAFIKYYKLPPKMHYEEMRKWISNHFNGYAAWAGQFLFEYIRTM